MKTKCYLVRLDSLIQISDKCYLATAFDGSEDYIPAKFIFGYDPAVQKSNAYWIAAWILERKNLQYSAKKVAWFNSDDYQDPHTPAYVKETKVRIHTPETIQPQDNNIIKDLQK